MKTKAVNTRNLTLFALFLALELMLASTPLGIIRLGIIGATTLHIPVIVAAVLLGKGAGAGLGLVFGLTSIINATLNPTPTAFVFSPFVEFAGVSGGIRSLIVAIVPRVLVGFLSGLTYEAFKKKKTSLAIGVSAVVGTLTNTVLVLGGIYVFFGQAYAQAVKVAYEALIGMLLTIVATNGVAEVALAILVCIPVCRALQHVMAQLAVRR